MTAPSTLRTYTPHMRLTASGTFQNGPTGAVIERWSWRLNLSDPSAGGSTSFSQARCDDYATDIGAFHSRVETLIYSFCRLTEVKLARIGSNGKYSADSFFKVLDIPGGFGSQMTRPPQVALAVSLGSATRGPRGQGRFYLPAPAAGLGTDLTVLPGDQEVIRASLNTLFIDLHNVPGVDPLGTTPRVTIASSKGTNSDVTFFRLGRALDTIRTRREDLKESYSVPTPVVQ